LKIIKTKISLCGLRYRVAKSTHLLHEIHHEIPGGIEFGDGKTGFWSKKIGNIS